MSLSQRDRTARSVRWAHNPKVAGSNPAPATLKMFKDILTEKRRLHRFLRYHEERDMSPENALTAIPYTNIIPKDISKILEVGCGEGAFLTLCLKKGVDAYAVDLRPKVWHEDARRRFSIANAVSLPFRNETFDLVRENMFFADIWQCQGLEESEKVRVATQSFNEMLRVLTPQGYIMSHGIYITFIPGSKRLKPLKDCLLYQKF